MRGGPYIGIIICVGIIITISAMVAGISREGQSESRQSAKGIQCGAKSSSGHRSAADTQIMRIGHTDLYIPVSWLRYNGMTTDSAGHSCTASLDEYLKPVFGDDDSGDVVHTLFRNPEGFANGLQFRISKSSLTTDDSRGDQPAGVDPQSSVYELSFAKVPLDQPDKEAASARRAKVLSLRQDNGWVKVGDYYYDVAGKYRRDRVAAEFPMDAAPASAWQNARYRFNDDIVVSYRRVSIGPYRVNFEGWRADRQSVDALVKWLATPPTQRDTKSPKMVGAPRPPKVIIS